MSNEKKPRKQRRPHSNDPKQEYLNQAFHLDELINSLIKEKDRLRKTAFSLGGTSFEKERVQGGNLPGSPFENPINRCIDLERKIDEEIDKLVDLKVEIRNVINGLSNKQQCLVLRHRYIEFMIWTDIQEEMGFDDVQRVYQIHREALKKIRIPIQ